MKVDTRRLPESGTVAGYDAADDMDGEALAHTIGLGHIMGGLANCLILDHFEGLAGFRGFRAETRTAQHEHGSVDCQSSPHFGDAFFRKPGVLLLQKRFEALGKLPVTELPGPVTLKLPIKRLGETRQNEIHQLFAHVVPSFQYGRAFNHLLLS
jgi:hypothetical protein